MRCRAAPCVGEGARRGEKGRDRKEGAGTEARGRPRNCSFGKENRTKRDHVQAAQADEGPPPSPLALVSITTPLLFPLTAFGEAFSLTRKNIRIYIYIYF